MAIIVDKVSAPLELKAKWAREAGLPENSQFLQRIARAKSYNRDMRDSLPTYPRTGDKLREKLNEYYIYTMPGLLSTIFSLLELDSDYTNGIRTLEDTAEISCRLSLPFVPGKTDIPDGKNQRVMFVTPSNTVDVTRVISKMEIPRIRRPLNGASGIPTLDGHLEVFIKEPKSRSNNLLGLDFMAYNLHPFGDDVDDLTFSSVWNTQQLQAKS